MGDCRVQFTLRHPLTFRESIYFQKLGAPAPIAHRFKLEHASLLGGPSRLALAEIPSRWKEETLEQGHVINRQPCVNSDLPFKRYGYPT